MRRRKARELALKMLYQMETSGNDPEYGLERYCEVFPHESDIIDYARYLLSGIKKEMDKIDGYIDSSCENWNLNRITYVDRNILRIGVFEMIFSIDCPPKVAINEAIELAKKYGSEDSKNFINGVLDRVLKENIKKGAA
ncbi:MAG TPA: transcription antitermination factor NusB [Syntrophorhabdaceae bacterium]|nr:transcription antitermination factor NusB [Syntrophorhabdaceae bacterium]HPU29364.1 transcription antitermination factor NusB [Syntrophorhabdaceae bacterium]